MLCLWHKQQLVCYAARCLWAAFHQPISLFCLPAAAKLMHNFNLPTKRGFFMGNWARELSNGSTKWKHVGDQRDTVYYTDKWFLVRQASKYGTAMNNDETQKEPKKTKVTSSDLGRRQERWRKGRQRWGGGVRGQRDDKEIDKRSNGEMDWKGSKWIGKGEKEGAREMQVGKRESRLTVKVDGDWWWHSSGLHGDECLMPWRLCLRMVNNESTINNNSSSQAGWLLRALQQTWKPIS